MVAESVDEKAMQCNFKRGSHSASVYKLSRPLGDSRQRRVRPQNVRGMFHGQHSEDYSFLSAVLVVPCPVKGK